MTNSELGTNHACGFVMLAHGPCMLSGHWDTFAHAWKSRSSAVGMLLFGGSALRPNLLVRVLSRVHCRGSTHASATLSMEPESGQSESQLCGTTLRARQSIGAA